MKLLKLLAEFPEKDIKKQGRIGSFLLLSFLRGKTYETKPEQRCSATSKTALARENP